MTSVLTLGPLRTTVVGAQKPSLAVVFCHGFGAPGTDLVGLGAELGSEPALSQTVRFYFPEAPLSLGGPYGGGRAWWMIPETRLLALQRGIRDPALWRNEVPEGMTSARQKLQAALDGVLADSGLGMDRVVLGGFSQGAMITTDLTLRLEEPPALLINYSGTLLAEAEWKKRAPARKGLRVLQSHGRQDPILPFENAEALRDLLQASGLEVEFLPFDGPHTIPRKALSRTAALLTALVNR